MKKIISIILAGLPCILHLPVVHQIQIHRDEIQIKNSPLQQAQTFHLMNP